MINVTIGTGLSTVGQYVFRNCAGLTSLVIPPNITSIGFGAFSECIGITSLTIPDSITAIGIGAFGNCKGLTSLVIPDGVVFLGQSAFQGCTGLTTLHIGSGITGISVQAFNGCTSLTGVVIPDTITSIGQNAFGNCTGLMGVYISRNVTTIANYAFYNCFSLLAVTLPDSVTYIGTNAFQGCASLVKLQLSQNLETIAASAFQGCSSLTSVNIPESVTLIGDLAFYQCPALRRAVFRGNAPNLFGSFVFHSAAQGFTIYYRGSSSGFTSPTWRGYPAEVISMATQAGSVQSGSGTITRGGVTTDFQPGDAVEQGDIIETSAGQEVTVSFVDDTEVEIDSNSKLTIDEYVFDPESGLGAQNFRLLRGIFIYSSGLIGREEPDDVEIYTPIGSIGIRGTAFSVDVQTNAETVRVNIVVTSGTVIVADLWKDLTHEITQGNSLEMISPIPSLETIRSKVECKSEISLKLSGYTDRAFTVQRSDNLRDWEDWLELDPSDLPLDVNAMRDPLDKKLFFRMKRTP